MTPGSFSNRSVTVCFDQPKIRAASFMVNVGFGSVIVREFHAILGP